MELGHVQGVCKVKDLKIRWALHGPEWEPTSRQRGIFIYRQLQKIGFDADAWDLKSPADIIVCQYDMKHLDAALATGATVVQDVNDQVFAEHHKCYPQFRDNLHRVHAVVAGTERLGQHLERLHGFVRVIHEPVDERYLAVQRREHEGTNFLYTGLHDNIVYFSEIDSVLERLAKKHDFTVHFVLPDKDGLGRPNSKKIAAKPYNGVFHTWTIETLLAEMAVADIGLVPLFQSAWEMCKSPNKAVSFMAAGLPVAASDVIPYRNTIKHGDNGYLCLCGNDWYEALDALLSDPKLRKRVGSKGRVTAMKFGVDKIAQKWVELFDEVRFA